MDQYCFIALSIKCNGDMLGFVCANACEYFCSNNFKCSELSSPSKMIRFNEFVFHFSIEYLLAVNFTEMRNSFVLFSHFIDEYLYGKRGTHFEEKHIVQK